MKKLLMLIVSVVMLTGWRSFNESSSGKRTGQGSPKDVAEDFVKAIVLRKTDKALEVYDTVSGRYERGYALRTKKQRDDLKKQLEDIGHEIDDEKFECKAILEDIMVPPESYGYHLVNGKKYTGEEAKVLVQFEKGEDKKPEGLEVFLVKVDGSWKVAGHEVKSGLDTSSEDSAHEDKVNVDKPKPGNFDRDSAKEDRVKAYEALCREYASLLKRKGQEIPEEAIEEEVGKFRKYSRGKQEEEIEKAETLLKEMKMAPRAEKKEEARPNSRKYDSKDASKNDGRHERLRKYERLCQEAVSLMKREGQEISEDDIEKEIEKFKKLSEEKQEAELKEAEEMLGHLRKVSRAKDADKAK